MTTDEYDAVRTAICRWATQKRRFDIEQIPMLPERSRSARIAVILDLMEMGWLRPAWNQEQTHYFEPNGYTETPRRCPRILAEIAEGTDDRPRKGHSADGTQQDHCEALPELQSNDGCLHNATQAPLDTPLYSLPRLPVLWNDEASDPAG